MSAQPSKLKLLSKQGIKSIDKKIANHMARIAADRDKLDEYISELTHLKGNCDEAYDALQQARDALSELV